MKNFRFYKFCIVTLILYTLMGVKLMAGNAHVHGHATMNVVLDSQNLVIYMSLTAHDVIGFEHLANNQQEKNVIDSAVAYLEATEDWLVLEKGDCHKQNVEVSNPFQSKKTDTDEMSINHPNFEVNINYLCQAEDEISEFSVLLNKRFKEIQNIEVQWLAHERQGLINLSDENHQVRFE